MKNCENCECEHDGSYGSGRFCSIKCARGFSTKAKRKEINEKVSRTLTKEPYIRRICKFCNKEFFVMGKRKNQTTCSRSCASKLKWEDIEYKEMMASINKKKAYERHENNDSSFGWKSRKKLKPSYPESIAINCLNSIGVEYEREMKFGKYYADFAIHDRKIIIEIDGQQHNKPERKRTDRIKDKLLNDLGWTVFRIKWPNDNIYDNIHKILQDEINND